MRVFEDSRRRLSRAKQHLEALISEWNALSLADSLKTDIQLFNNGNGIVIATLPSLPENQLAIVLGEFFYQLRAALDCTVYTSAVLVEGEDPPDNVQRLYFPIYQSAKDFRSSVFATGKLPQGIKDWIESLQPYNCAQTVGTSLSKVNKTLELLNDCANKDRHRHLHILVAVPQETSFTFGYPETVRITGVQPIPCNLLEGDTEILKFHVEGLESLDALAISLESKLSLEISIEEVTIERGKSLADELSRMLCETDRIIQTFEAAFQSQ